MVDEHDQVCRLLASSAGKLIEFIIRPRSSSPPMRSPMTDSRLVFVKSETEVPATRTRSTRGRSDFLPEDTHAFHHSAVAF